MSLARSLAAAGATLTLIASLAACSSPAEPAGSAAADTQTERVESQAPEPAAEPTWTPVATITGNADQQSDTIVLTGGKVRVTYDFVDSSGQGVIVGAVYVLPEGTDLMTDGGIPDVMISEAGAGETILRKDAGEYYVKVTSANASYTVTVEEEK
ncbi:hypothetical protein [Microbacterium aurum]